MRPTRDRYAFLPPTELKPRGWLLRELRLQAEGLAGNLDRMWPDVRDSAWIGGNREGWERVPYWLDGFVPLAWLLEDPGLKARAQRYIDHILAAQQPDGWLCPCPQEKRQAYDLWALFLILKVLALYGDCSGDARAEEAVYRALRNLLEHLRTSTLFTWAATRWFECLIPIFWIYERRPEPWLLELGEKLRAYGLDWDAVAQADWWHEPRDQWAQDTHVVNLAMALKAEALSAKLSGRTAGECGGLYRALTRYHSTCWGLFTGDECLSGDSPIQGTELCAVAEAMYSFERLLAVTGDPVWGDRLEKVAFNAYPAATSADLWTHQYDQASNQPFCARMGERPIFRTNGTEASLFGLEPNYGCCTANHGQAWPKLALSAFLRDEEGILSAVPVPMTLETTVDGTAVRVELETDYPFRGALRYTVKTASPVEFTLKLRIPGTADTARVNGAVVKPGTICALRRRWCGEQTVTVTLEAGIHGETRPNGLVCLRRGSLYYALPVKARRVKHEYVRDGVERKAPWCDWELFADSEWQFGLAGTEFTWGETPVPEMPFDPASPPVYIGATLAPIRWGFQPGFDTVPARVPESLEPTGPARRMRLVPYGCTDLRMTELPLL